MLITRSRKKFEMNPIRIIHSTYTGAILIVKTLITKCPINATKTGSFARIIFTIATATNCRKFQQKTVHRIKHKYPLQSAIDLLKASIEDLFSIIMAGIEATRSEVKITKTTTIMRA